MQLADGAQCENDLGESAFHIEHTGTAYRVAVHGKRPLLDRPDRPYRIEVPDQQLVAAVPGTVRRSREDMPDTAGHPRLPYGVADIHKRAGQYPSDTVVALRVRGRRLRLHERLQKTD
jgi:hypothetical protein